MQQIRFDTERLTVRQFCEKDADGYFRLFENPRVHCFMDEKMESVGQAEEAVRMKAEQNDGSELAVCLKDTGELIGSVFGLWEKDTFSVCWIFRPDCCGKGYAYEAARAYFDFLFDRMNARRIYAYVEDYNTSSQRLCRKLGMRQEGLFKEFVSFVNNPDGTPLYENTMQFAILKKEWKDHIRV